MNRLTHRLLLSSIICGGLTSGLWAQNRGDMDRNQAGQNPSMNHDDSMKHDDMDKAGMRGDWNKPHMTLLHENFGLRLRPLQREQAASHEVKPGVGLVVEEVTPSSIAANGGLQKGDVIFQVGDQWVINPQQFATLLSIQDPNDNFEVKVRRGTERVDLDYKFDQTALDTMNRTLTPAMGDIDQRTDRSMNRGNEGMDNNPMIIPEKFDFKDDLHSINIRTENGVKKLLVKDKDGNVLFDGPYNTAQDREAVPADIKLKVERVLREKVK